MDTRGAKQHEIEKVVSGCMKVNGHRERYAKHHFEDSTYKPDHSRLEELAVFCLLYTSPSPRD